MSEDYSSFDNVYENTARRVKGYAEDHGMPDILTILMIISIILTVIRILQACSKTPNDCHSMINARDPLAMLTMKQVIQQKVGRKLYREHGDEILESVLAVGSQLSTDEFTALYNEAELAENSYDLHHCKPDDFV